MHHVVITAGCVRPANIVGSWAIFAADEKVNITGGKLYRSGKVGHIFNSLMSDAKGVTARTNPQIVDNGDGTGTLTVNLDKDFLDNAVYPIKHAAGLTFGYTSVGASTAAWGANFILYSQPYSPASSGVINSISLYLDSATAHAFALGIYESVSDSPTNLLAQGTPANEATGWNTHNTTTNPTITGGAEYHLALWGASLLTNRYDSGGGARSYQSITYTGTFPATATPTGYIANLDSIYATYTPAGPSLPVLMNQYRQRRT